MVENKYKRGVVFYEVSKPHKDKHIHITDICCRRFKTSYSIHVMITCDKDDMFSYSPIISFCKKNVEEFLLTLFEEIKLK